MRPHCQLLLLMTSRASILAFLSAFRSSAQMLSSYVGWFSFYEWSDCCLNFFIEECAFFLRGLMADQCSVVVMLKAVFWWPAHHYLLFGIHQFVLDGGDSGLFCPYYLRQTLPGIAVAVSVTAVLILLVIASASPSSALIQWSKVEPP